MQSRRLVLQTFVLSCFCLALVWGRAQAQSDEAFVQYRQKVMQAVGASMGAIGETMKNKLPYQQHIVTHAKNIEALSGLIYEAFKKEVSEGKTDAKPEIWKEWDKFIGASKALGEESHTLAEVAASGDAAAIGAQVKKLGEACGDCHKAFRKPKEESYKNK
jgi:cytochrome c556